MNALLVERINTRILNETMPKTSGPGWKDGLPINNKIYLDAVAKMTPAERKAFDAKLKAKSSQVKKAHAKAESDFWNEHKHTILQAAAIASLFIPVPGVNAGLYVALQALDAAAYVQEGDRYGALLTAGFALLPGAGKLGKAAVIKMLGPKGMAKLGAKVAAWKTGKAAVKKTILSKTEQAALKLLSANQKEVAKLIALRARQIAASKAGTAINWAANKAGRTVKGAANFIGKAALGYGAVTTAVDPIYKGMGWEEADIDDQIGADEILSGLK